MGSVSETHRARFWDPEESMNHPMYSERPLRVICIGAGASGLILAYKLQRSFQNFSLIVYEKNNEVSGTWYENRYPG
jgi:cation diffusion facilitator CzcD-associated flavoprotein CzcO